MIELAVVGTREWRKRRKAHKETGVPGIAPAALSKYVQGASSAKQTRKDRRWHEKQDKATAKRLADAYDDRYRNPPKRRGKDALAEAQFRADIAVSIARPNFFEADQARILTDHLTAVIDRYEKREPRHPALDTLRAMRDMTNKGATYLSQGAELKVLQAEAEVTLDARRTMAREALKQPDSPGADPDATMKTWAAMIAAERSRVETIKTKLRPDEAQAIGQDHVTVARRLFHDMTGEGYKPRPHQSVDEMRVELANSALRLNELRNGAAQPPKDKVPASAALPPALPKSAAAGPAATTNTRLELDPKGVAQGLPGVSASVPKPVPRAARPSLGPVNRAGNVAHPALPNVPAAMPSRGAEKNLRKKPGAGG